MPSMFRHTIGVAVCLGLALVLISCGAAHRTTAAHDKADAAPDSTLAETEPLATEESLRYAQDRISLARRALSSGKTDLAIAEVDLASDILATAEIDTEGQPRLFKQYVELLRLLEQTRREVTPAGAPVPGEDAPALAFIQTLDNRTLESLSEEDVQQALVVKKIAATCEIPVDCTPAVLRSIRFLTTTARKTMADWLSRAATYTPMILTVLEEEGLPRDLAYLPTIESSYNPLAISSAQAVGMWQFVADTARIFGLRNDDWVDERRDPEKSTRAAARYLKFLYERQGDWRLALASYNWGRLNVDRAMEKAGTRNFWDLTVPRDTRNYVPLFMAVAVIARSPETFGFKDVTPGPPWRYDPVPLSSPVDLRVVANCAGTSYETLRGLNPALKWSVTPPSERYALRLPPGAGDRFLKRFAALPPERRSVWRGYRVGRRETLASIAARYGVSPDMLADANGLKPGQRPKKGQRLLVPLLVDRTADAVASAPAPPPQSRAEQTASKPQVQPAAGVRAPLERRPMTYLVRRGDTLFRIARAQGVSVEQLRAWNKLSSKTRLRPGRRLTIWKDLQTEDRAPVRRASGESSGRLKQYTVRRGDTLWRISQKHGVEVDQILAWNDLPDASAIRPGDQLKIWTKR